MKSRFCLASILFLLVFPASGVRGQQVKPHGDDENAIRALLQKMAEANNAGDIEGWVRLFAADGVYMPPGTPPVTTRAGLVSVAKAGFRNQVAVEIRPVEVHVCGDWAFARTHVTGTVKVHDTGKVIPVDVKELFILSRAPGGEWRIARLINNRNTE